MLISLASAGSAHAGMKHLKGTVSVLSAQVLTVKTTTGETVDVAIDNNTRFTRGEAPVGPDDVKVGDRVVIHASKKDGKYAASEVELGTVTPAKPAAHNH
jgi:hypothetical protein